MPTDNLQQALANAAAGARKQHPALTAADVNAAYARYREHFERREEDPPVSEEPATDDLLLALWDVIVDRETQGADEVDGELEDYYARAFAGLLGTETEQQIAAEPVAIPTSSAEPTDAPAPVMEESEELTDLVEERADPGREIYQLRVTLDGSQPEIWRRLLVPADVRETRLHHIIQAAMGWRGTEQFQFYPQMDRELPSTEEPRLCDLLVSEGQQCGYEFDSGDSWYHDIMLETRVEPEARRHYPVCTAGQGACPPEDVGGIPGYKRLLEALNDPNHPDHEEMSGWLTQDFHPDAFNIEQANVRLGKYGDAGFHAVV
ncbi:plasmid pRiA4b ORF-3 family protein [Lewinella sp. JB7]|uniref:plasmid pRiA4b ORF-3 family protein n=1 Tax=Lewinella sp. JB7 TaxID=2962887 RepID=UPI0020CA1C7D|nr:plasmid pRiA4b ORF-3 family protein [Lewinella sp. JB7]MCP9237125.1 plasmid pRiA4b ORF-3 family protein [Lewinella sp. JB7]